MSRPSPEASYRYSWAPGPVFLPAGPWVAVAGGDLPVPVMLRVHRRTDGRYVFTGISVGDEFSPQEITSQVLRRISLSRILAALFEGFDPDHSPDWIAGAVSLAADVNAEAGGHAATGRARGPGDQALRDFARSYQIELARQPQRAMTAAAKAHSISRATAHRWAALCRQLGYLPGPPGRHQQGDQE